MQYKFFLAGIISKSRDGELYNQSYRQQITQIIHEKYPDSEVFCPVEKYPNSLNYSTYVEGLEVFFDILLRASKTDVLICFAPEASMSTAISMWEAYKAGRLVLTISPLKDNWTVKFLSHKVFNSIQAFEDFINSNELNTLKEEVNTRRYRKLLEDKFNSNK